MLQIGKNGSVSPLDARELKILCEHAGEWNITPVGSDLLVARRHVEGRPADAGVLISGEMRKFGWLIEIFSFIGNARLTGTLITLDAREIRRDFFFEGGMLKMASSSVATDLFGEFAVKQGVISRQQLDTALATQTPGTKIGQILHELGLITAPEIHNLLCRKIEKIFNDAVVMEQGIYYFLTGTDLPRLPASIRIDTHALLIEAARRVDEYRHKGPQTTPITPAQE